MVPEMWNVREFFLFLPFHFPNNPENHNFEKVKKALGDIILHKCTINNNHMIYDS